MARLFLLVCLSVVLFAGRGVAEGPVPTQARASAPMRVVLVHDARSDCGEDCLDWISAEGDFTKETPAAFREVFRTSSMRRRSS